MIETDSSQPKPIRAIRGGIQPKHHAQKTRAAAKARRKQIIRDVAAGKPLQQAGIDAGLSPTSAASQVSRIVREPQTQDALLAALEKRGLTDDYAADHHRQLIEATKVISAMVIAPGSGSDLKDAGSMTRDFVEVPDNQAKAKGLEMLYKLRGKFTEKHEHDIKQPVNIIIRKFCSRTPTDKPSAGGEKG